MSTTESKHVRPFQDELQFNVSSIQNEWSILNFTSSNADFTGTASTKPIPDRNSSVEFLFECSVIAIASVGTLANGFVIAILLSQLRKKTKLTTSNKFTINQLVLDLYSCMAAILVYGWKMMNTRTDRKWNYITCVLIGSESILWAGVNGSITNLVFITLERYVKIVHSMAHKRYYRNWITSVCIALSWLNGMLCSVPATLVTLSYSDFPEGVCEALTVWPHPYDGQIFGCYTIVSFYFIPLLVFIVCYSRIIAAIRNSASHFQVTTSNSRAASVTRHNSVALIKTMVIITVLFAICWSPNDIYFLLTLLDLGVLQGLSIDTFAWYATLFIGFLTVCVHPFIYGTRIDLVKNFFRKPSPASKTVHQSHNATECLEINIRTERF